MGCAHNHVDYGVDNLVEYEVLYISGAISAEKKHMISLNVKRGKHYARKWFQKGYAIHCPHLQTQGFTDIGHWDDFIDRDLSILAKCDGIVMMPGWRYSRGACVEYMFAEKEGMKIIYDDEYLSWVEEYPVVGDIVYLPHTDYHTGGMAIITEIHRVRNNLFMSTYVSSAKNYFTILKIQSELKDKYIGKWSYNITGDV